MKTDCCRLIAQRSIRFLLSARSRMTKRRNLEPGFLTHVLKIAGRPWLRYERPLARMCESNMWVGYHRIWTRAKRIFKLHLLLRAMLTWYCWSSVKAPICLGKPALEQFSIC